MPDDAPIDPPVTRLLTHGGAFHADEVLATAVLTTLWPEATLIRTRERDMVDEAKANMSALVYDVGGVCAPAMRVFDHHQPDPPRRGDATPYSAFGLIWQAYGAEWLRRIGIAPALVSDAHAELDTGFVRAIDQIDNGCLSPREMGAAGTLILPTLIGDLVPESDTPGPMADAFERARVLAGQVLSARAYRVARGCAARNELADLIATQSGDPILELPRGMPFAGAVHGPEAAHIRFVMHPRTDDWVLHAISVEPATRALRQPFPAAWAGLEGAALAAVSGVPDALFCHRNRFLAVAASRAGARALASKALCQASGDEAGQIDDPPSK